MEEQVVWHNDSTNNANRLENRIRAAASASRNKKSFDYLNLRWWVVHILRSKWLLKEIDWYEIKYLVAKGKPHDGDEETEKELEFAQPVSIE